MKSIKHDIFLFWWQHSIESMAKTTESTNGVPLWPKFGCDGTILIRILACHQRISFFFKIMLTPQYIHIYAVPPFCLYLYCCSSSFWVNDVGPKRNSAKHCQTPMLHSSGHRTSEFHAIITIDITSMGRIYWTPFQLPNEIEWTSWPGNNIRWSCGCVYFFFHFGFHFISIYRCSLMKS